MLWSAKIGVVYLIEYVKCKTRSIKLNVYLRCNRKKKAFDDLINTYKHLKKSQGILNREK